MASAAQYDEHAILKTIVRDELFELAAFYPYLPRVDADLQYIESAIRDGDEKLLKLAPFIDAYAHLKIRGYLGQVIFIYVFMDIAKLRHPMQLNYATEGARLIEGSAAYQAEFAEQFLRMDLDTLWHELIAYRELNRLATGRGVSSKVRLDAMRDCDCVTASYTLSEYPQFTTRGRMKKNLRQTRTNDVGRGDTRG
jgi:hypothetical protein